jgi:hypothetical protein
MKPATMDQVIAARPGQVRVTRGDEAVLVFGAPKVIGDRLGGFVDGKYQMIPIADVKHVLMRTPARGRTVALIGTTMIGVVGVAYILAGGGDGGDPCSDQSSDCEPGSPFPE